MNFKQNQHIRAKGRGIFYLLLLAAIAMSALIGACDNGSGGGDSMTLNLSYPAEITGTVGAAITAANPTWSSTPEGDVAYAIDLALPAGLELASGTGIISGTPTAAAAKQDYTITATLADGTEKTATISITITKELVNIANLDTSEFSLTVDDTSVTLSTEGSHRATVGGTLTAGTDYDLSITGPGVTSGAVSIANDGAITMTSAIALSDTGDYTVTATGKGDYTGEVIDTFTLTVSNQPVLGSITYDNGDFTLGVQITDQSPIGTNSDQADYAMKTGESLPAGLSLAADGTISGTPTAGSSQTTYTIVATGKTGTDYEGEVKEITISISVASLPGAPTNINIAPGDSKLVVSWDAPADKGYSGGSEGVISEYTVYWGTSTGVTTGSTDKATVQAPATSYEIPSLTNGDTYYVIVTATTGAGEGPASTESSAAPIANSLPEAPANININPGDTKLTVNWDAPANTGIYNGIAGVISGYTVYWDTSSGVSKSSANSHTTGAAATSYEITGLTNNQMVYVIVTATTDAGEGPAPTEVSATPVPDNALPGKPTITSIDQGDGKLVVRWSAPADKGFFNGIEGVISEYTVYWKVAPGVTTGSTDKATVQAPATSHEVAPLANGQNYYFIVTATTGAGEGPASDEASAAPVAGNAPPGAPTNVSATAGSTQVEVSWTAPTDNGIVGGSAGVPEYRIYYSTTQGFDIGTAPSREAGNSATSLMVDGLTDLTTYYFKVVAFTAVGESSPSGEVSATPKGVVLDVNGGTGNAAAAMLAGLSGTIPDASYGTLTKADSAFAGWNTAADGSGTTTYRSGDAYDFTDVTTLYAEWLTATAELRYDPINNDAEYAVFYDKVGLTQADVDQITSVTIPAYWQEKPVTEIGQPVDVPSDERAFYQHDSVGEQLLFSSMTSVTMPEGLKRIHEKSFADSSLSALTSLPDSVTRIDDFAFQSTDIALSSFPSSLTRIGVAAFQSVKTLAATEFPANIILSSYPFQNANVAFNNIVNVTLNDGQHFQGVTFANPAVTLTTSSTNLNKTFQGSNVTSVDLTLLHETARAYINETFIQCSSLTTVTVRYGSSVAADNRKVPQYTDAFSGASSLTAIYVPADLVDDFKNATGIAAGWSTHAAIIQAIP